MATDLHRWVFSLSLRRIWASFLQHFSRKSMLKSQIQLSQYDRCQTQRSKEFKQCRPFQIYQSALGFPRFSRVKLKKPFSPGQWRAQIYVFLVMFFTVKNSREQATSQRLHFSMSWEGFGNGMKNFCPDSFNSMSDFGNLSGYLESDLHLPQQQCLVLTISWSSW